MTTDGAVKQSSDGRTTVMPASTSPPAPSRSDAMPLIVLGLIITLGFSAIFGFLQLDSRDQARERARLAAYNVIAAMASEIDRNLELYDLSLQAVVEGLRVPGLAKLNTEVRQLVLFDRAATAKDMGSIFVLDKHGTVIIDSRAPTPQPYNFAQEDFFKKSDPKDRRRPLCQPAVDRTGRRICHRHQPAADRRQRRLQRRCRRHVAPELFRKDVRQGEPGQPRRAHAGP